MSLFLKIFLWFWLAMALIIGGVMLVNWSTSSEPLARQWETFVGESVTINAGTSVQIYEAEGLGGLNEYFKRLELRRRVSTVSFYGENGILIAGKEGKNRGAIVKKAFGSDKPEFERHPEFTLAAKKAFGSDGKAYVYTVEITRFQPPAFFTPRLLLQILTVVLMGGLVCYGLAKYLTSPITKLRNATQALADGNFETRVSDKIGKRRDELSKLANDFDEMARRIESLISSEKRLTQDISHELRSPLARMNVALELARSKANTDTLPLLERLEKESQRLNDLIGQLLTLSKLETGSDTFQKTEIDLGKLVDGLVSDADFEAAAIERGVTLKETTDVMVLGNETLLRSAIENVLRNASRYTPKGTKVEVALHLEQQSAVLTIRDFGEGVPDEELEKLFRPFYRISASRDRKSGGIGLGLAIAESAVSNHGGTIRAANTGNGLEVEIRLPALN